MTVPNTASPLTVWTRMTVGDIGQYINGVAFRDSDWREDGLPIIRIQNLTDESKPFNRTTREVAEGSRINDGDILVSWSATLDAFRWNRGPAVLNQHIFKVIPNADLVDDRFLFYLLKKAISEMKQSAHLHGSTMKHINRGPFLAHQVTIPPLEEQREIVALIETQLARLDDVVASLERAKARLKRYQASVLKAASEGRLVPNEAELARLGRREYEPASVLLERIKADRDATAGSKPGKADRSSIVDVSELPDLPEGWAWAQPDQLAGGERNALSIGPFGSNLKVNDYRDQGVPLIFVRNIRAKDFGNSGTKYVTWEKAQELSSHKVQGGDVLITKMGDPPGDTAIYPPGSPEAIITADCIRFQVHSELVAHIDLECLSKPVTLW